MAVETYGNWGEGGGGGGGARKFGAPSTSWLLIYNLSLLHKSRVINIWFGQTLGLLRQKAHCRIM